MGSKNISIRKDVYEKLKIEKRPDESFTEVIDRLLKSEKPPLTKFSGTISEKTAVGMERTLEILSEMEKREIAKLHGESK